MSTLAIKLTSLAIRTLAKPIANQIKQQAHEHERFRQLCINLAQTIHRADMRIRLGLLRDSTITQKAELAAEHAKPKAASSSSTSAPRDGTKITSSSASKETGTNSQLITPKDKAAEISRDGASKEGALRDSTSPSLSSSSSSSSSSTTTTTTHSHQHSHHSTSSSPSSPAKKKAQTTPHIRPLSDVKALERGANFISEAFLFTVAGSLILFEAVRSRMKESARRDMVQERLERLEETDEVWRKKVEVLEQRLEAAGIKGPPELPKDKTPPKRIWDETGGWFGRKWRRAVQDSEAEDTERGKKEELPISAAPAPKTEVQVKRAAAEEATSPPPKEKTPAAKSSSSNTLSPAHTKEK